MSAGPGRHSNILKQGSKLGKNFQSIFTACFCFNNQLFDSVHLMFEDSISLNTVLVSHIVTFRVTYVMQNV